MTESVLHDCDSRRDPKVAKLRCRGGLLWYGIYWACLEKLVESADYRFQLDYELIDFDLQVGAEAVKACIELAIEIGLFETDGEWFWSNKLIERRTKYEEKREQARKAGKASAEARRTQKEHPLSDTGADVERTFNIVQTSDDNRKEIIDNDLKKNCHPEKIPVETANGVRHIHLEQPSRYPPTWYAINATQWASLSVNYARGDEKLLQRSIKECIAHIEAGQAPPEVNRFIPYLQKWILRAPNFIRQTPEERQQATVSAAESQVLKRVNRAPPDPKTKELVSGLVKTMGTA